MSDRAPHGRPNKSEDRGETSIRGEARRWFNQKDTHMHRGRVRGLSAKEIPVWFSVAPPKGFLLGPFRKRAFELIEMDENNLTKQGWAKAIAKADTETFELYISREDSVDHLNDIIREIGVNGKSNERVAVINQRKQELDS